MVFVLSNGRHPDPTKADAEVAPEVRLKLLESAIAEIHDPDRSQLARRAKLAGESLYIGPERVNVWTREFEFSRAVRAAETVLAIRAAHGDEVGPVNWLVGTDLLHRMADPAIFSDGDMQVLVRECRFAVLERDGQSGADSLAALAAARNLSPQADVFRKSEAPDWLAPFLELSSTQIRNAAETGDPLGAMLPRAAAEAVLSGGLYRPGRPVAHLRDESGILLAARSALERRVEELEKALREEAGRVFDLLEHRREAGAPHSLAIVEATVGGLLTQAFAGRSGASRFFRQARFAYDQRAKESLVGARATELSAVSQAMAVALAEGIREQAGTDLALAESGMAGPPDGVRRSLKSGLCHIALVTPTKTHTTEIHLNPFLTRREHQLRFAAHALASMREWLAGDGP